MIVDLSRKPRLGFLHRNQVYEADSASDSFRFPVDACESKDRADLDEWSPTSPAPRVWACTQSVLSANPRRPRGNEPFGRLTNRVNTFDDSTACAILVKWRHDE